MNPITIPNITIPVIGLPTIGIPSVGFPSASGGGLVWPKGLKESIKAIYDPAKQGMTNYDVIESYATDFKYWSKTTGITHVNEYTMSFRDVPIKGYVLRVDDFVPFSILVSGLTNGEIITTTYMNNNREDITITITKNGIYSYPIDSIRIIFNCITAIQNATVTQLPTSILKDLSGNGNHAYLYGGKGKLNSGMGVYSQDFTSYTSKNGVINSFTNIFTKDNRFLSLAYSNMTKDIEPYNINVKGIINETITYFYRNEEGVEKQFIMTKDGNYTVPKCYKDGTAGTSNSYTANNTNENTKITITQIPDYPNQLCYDGKMYAVCYGFPILTDYTVMADRTWFEKKEANGCFISKRNGNNLAAFNIEWRGEKTNSFGNATVVSYPTLRQEIIWQTKNLYNGKSLSVGSAVDSNILYVGCGNVADLIGDPYIGCHGKIIIADRSFTEGEITWLKDNWKKI